MTCRRHSLVLALLPIALSACGGDDDMMMMPPPTINVTITNTNAASDDLMEGVEVCVANFTGYDCQVSDATGVVTIESPANSDVLYSFTGMGLYRGLHMLTTGDTDMAFESEVAPTAIVNVTAASAGMMLMPGTATILIRTTSTPGTGDPVGFSFTLDPAPAMGTPVYFDESLVPSAMLTETTLTGAAAFVNTTPGDYDLVVMHAAKHCTVEAAWERDTADHVGLHAEADTLTVVKVDDCM
jgi:hypothetical protein